MSRLFWIGVGAAVGVALTRKVKQTARSAPVSVATTVGDAISELAGAIGAFGADVRAGMTEREEELADVVEQRSGVTPGLRRAPGERRDQVRDSGRRPASSSGRHDARARRADG